MSDDDNKSGKWTLYPPGMPGKMGMPEHLEKPMKVEVKDTYTALKDLADIINGSQLTRVEVDEFQLGICFTSEIHISVFYGIVFYPSEKPGVSTRYCPNDMKKNYDFMSLIGKTVSKALPDEDMNLLLQFGDFGSLKVLRDEHGLESYKISEPMPGSWLVV